MVLDALTMPFLHLSSFFQWLIGGAEGFTYVLSRWIFLRAFGVIYLIVFVSLWVQIKGLIGEQGILPAQEFLDVVGPRLGSARHHLLPTIFWFTGASDALLQLSCALGILCSVLLIVGIAPMPMLLVLWVLYLSFFNVGRDFLSFQWDTLLLETGLLAILFAPASLLPGLARETAVSPVMLVLLWWLLFRFTFESGAVKLVSGDRSWLDLSALTYHYFSQPLPTWTAWYVHHLPLWFHKLSTIFMYIVELLLPFLIFSPRSFRIASCVGMVLFQIIIGLTGNYNFFNLLTIALCLLLLDDAVWIAILPERFLQWLGETGVQHAVPLALLPAIAIVAGVYLLVSVFQLIQTDHPRPVPGFVLRLERLVDPFHSINEYGLFRVMTKRRPEIIVEGSDDGKTWLAYEFKWKPGDIMRRPRFVEPHQPRLDWQMWFAALRSRGHPLAQSEVEEWFQSFLGRLLQGSPDVLALLKHNPFPEKPPKYIRSMLYEYVFTSPKEKKATGAWWKRKLLGAYSPVLSLQ